MWNGWEGRSTASRNTGEAEARVTSVKSQLSSSVSASNVDGSCGCANALGGSDSRSANVGARVRESDAI